MAGVLGGRAGLKTLISEQINSVHFTLAINQPTKAGAVVPSQLPLLCSPWSSVVCLVPLPDYTPFSSLGLPLCLSPHSHWVLPLPCALTSCVSVLPPRFGSRAHSIRGRPELGKGRALAQLWLSARASLCLGPPLPFWSPQITPSSVSGQIGLSSPQPGFHYLAEMKRYLLAEASSPCRRWHNK